MVGALIGVGLWIWMGVKNRAGRNWARITGTVFFGLDTIFLLVGISRLTAPAIATEVLIWAAGLATVILLWQRRNAAYFAGDGQPMQGWQR